MFDGFPTQKWSSPIRATSPLSLTVDYAGPARVGLGEAGSLYCASNGNTYFVPSVYSNGGYLPMIDGVVEVISNLTGFYNDMLFIPVQPGILARGLYAALTVASSLRAQLGDGFNNDMEDDVTLHSC